MGEVCTSSDALRINMLYNPFCWSTMSGPIYSGGEVLGSKPFGSSSSGPRLAQQGWAEGSIAGATGSPAQQDPAVTKAVSGSPAQQDPDD